MIDIRKVLVVYMGGGMKNGWQDRLKKEVAGVIFIDPREHGQKDEKAYTAWDLAGVERSDVVFGYMEASNPGGSGLALEFGWGGRAGKVLLLAAEPGYPQERYFGMVRALSHANFAGEQAFERAVECLKFIRDNGVAAFMARAQQDWPADRWAS